MGTNALRCVCSSNQRHSSALASLLQTDFFVWRNLLAQYYLSGLLTATECDYWVLVAVCSVIAERVFSVFDATRTGLLVSLATAALGPLIEVCVRAFF